MLWHLAGRTLWAVTLLFGVIIGSFIMFQVAPGDTARIILGPNASEDAVINLRRQMGIDRPLPNQMYRQVESLVRLDLGRSTIDGRSVSLEVWSKFTVTARVGLLGAVFALLVSYVLNFVVFVFPQFKFLLNLSFVGIVTPTFFTGVVVALLFGIWFPVFSLSGYGSDGTTWSVLPSIVAAFYPIALMTRLLREKILAASAADFARAAEAFGSTKPVLFHRTLLPTVAVSWLAAWVNQISLVFIASFFIEVIFTIPGIGVLLISAIQRKDFPMLQGILLVNAVFFIGLSWLSDVVFGWLDPRLRQNEAA